MTTQVELIDAQQVEEVFLGALWKNEELATVEKDERGVPNGAVIVEGLMNVAFHPERLEAKREQVTEWLRLLPHQFRKNGGGGWSFLNACMQENGEQWTGMQSIMDHLFCLAMGLRLAECQMPREMWSALPGGMPYYAINVE